MRSRILCISGQEQNARELAAMLHSLPVLLEYVGSLQQARVELVKHEYDVVLTEAHLTDGDWLDVLHLAREVPHELAVVVTDRQADASLWSRALNLGVYDVLPQPFEEREVRRILQNACTRIERHMTAV